MEITLGVSIHHVKGHKHFRLNVPSDVAKKLDLKEGDKIRMKILRVIRQ